MANRDSRRWELAAYTEGLRRRARSFLQRGMGGLGRWRLGRWGLGRWGLGRWGLGHRLSMRPARQARAPLARVSPGYLTPRLRLALALIVLHGALFVLLRIVFAWFFEHTTVTTWSGIGGPVSDGRFWYAFYLGFKFDLRFTLFLVLPLLVLGWLPGLNPVRSRVARAIWIGYFVLAALLWSLVYVLDFGHYAYQVNRLNATVLEYLQAPWISAKVVWESYSILPLVLALALVLFGYGWGIARWIFPLLARSGPRSWGRRLLLGVLAWVLLLLGIYGQFSFYPLRWSQAFFSPDPYLNALALNPVLFLVDTYDDRVIPYDEEEARRLYPQLAAWRKLPHPQKLGATYTVYPQGRLPRKTNVVVILLESFGNYVVGGFGNPLSPTPHFDALLPQSIVFTRFFTPTGGTARSIFTLLIGIPDVDNSSTSTRNPLIVNQHMLFNEVPHERIYMLGGSANWGNLRGVLTHNVQSLYLYEEGDYDAPRTDVWGISDLQLLLTAHDVFQDKHAAGRPFFAVVQTAGSHSPYTIPKENHGFVRRQAEADALRSAGFASEKQYNAYLFLDHALGQFLQRARESDYYRDTVFVLLGDHGLPQKGDHTPAGIKQHLLTRFHVPLVIHAPYLLKEPRRIAQVSSEIDVMPTLAGLLGIPYRYRGLGRDLFAAEGVPWAWVYSPSSSAPEVGLLDAEFFLHTRPGGESLLYRYESTHPDREVQAEYPQVYKEMEAVSRAILETNRYLLYHNPALPALQARD